jgi:holo-[acyl-carrier protein] synthase
VDLVSVGRIDGLLKRWGTRFTRRVYTESEIEYCLRAPSPARSFAARFAAKEAFFKAVSSARRGPIGFRDIEVVMGDDGGPRIRYHGRAAEALGRRRAALSLSHEAGLAVAVVITSPEVRD